MQWEKFKKLDFLCETKPDSKACVVLFHGYGADANDLASLQNIFKLEASADWFFPQGVHSVAISPMMSGRAWFQLRMSDFENLAQNKVADEGIDPEVKDVITQVTNWLNHLGKLYDQVFIGGFSQGAILTSHCFYRLNFTPAGLLLLSGSLMVPSEFPGTVPEPLRAPFFQSHGGQDPVLPLPGAQKLHSKLIELGLEGNFMEFSGGHEIPISVIQRAQTFLNFQLNS